MRTLRRDSWMFDEESQEDPAATRLVLRKSCAECLLLGPLFTVVVLLQYMHMSTPHAYAIEKTLQFEVLGKPFGFHSFKVKDVHNARMFWQWFETSMNDTLAVQVDELGHKLLEDEWGYISSFNEIIGGIHLQQDRSAKTPCPGDKSLECHGHAREDHSDFGYPQCPNLSSGGDDSSVGCYRAERYEGAVDIEQNEGFHYDTTTGHFEMFLDPREDHDVTFSRIRYLEDRRWIDKQTRLLQVKILTRNYEYELLYSEVVVEFRFDRAGNIMPKFRIETIPGDPYEVSAGVKVFLATLYLFIAGYAMVRLLLDVRTVRRSLSFGSTLLQHLGEHCAAEALQVVVFIATASLWTSYVLSMGDLKGRIEALQRPGSHSHSGAADYEAWLSYQHEVAEIEASMSNQVSLVKGLRNLASLMFLSILISCFKVWKGIPALAMVTQTISLSTARLGALTLAASTLLFLFSGAAMVVYGSQMSEFSNILAAVRTTAIVCFTGEHEVYERMSLFDPLFASLWYWALVFLMFMVVLNQALGILLDAAASVKKSGTAVGLYEQLRMLLDVFRVGPASPGSPAAREDRIETAPSNKSSKSSIINRSHSSESTTILPSSLTTLQDLVPQPPPEQPPDSPPAEKQPCLHEGLGA